jgi:hypothetical protein
MRHAEFFDGYCNLVANHIPAFDYLIITSTMSLAATRFVATRVMARRGPVQQQKRGIIDYLTNYPDKVRLLAPPFRARDSWVDRFSPLVVAGIDLLPLSLTTFLSFASNPLVARSMK